MFSAWNDTIDAQTVAEIKAQRCEAFLMVPGSQGSSEALAVLARREVANQDLLVAGF